MPVIGMPSDDSLNESPELIAQEYFFNDAPKDDQWGLNESPELIAQEYLDRPVRAKPHRASMKVLSLLLRNGRDT